MPRSVASDIAAMTSAARTRPSSAGASAGRSRPFPADPSIVVRDLLGLDRPSGRFGQDPEPKRPVALMLARYAGLGRPMPPRPLVHSGLAEH